MAEHYNVQVSIQRVIKVEAPTGYRSPAEKVADSNAPVMAREIVKVMDVSVVAASEIMAYAKAIRLIQVNMPEPTEPDDMDVPDPLPRMPSRAVRPKA